VLLEIEMTLISIAYVLISTIVQRKFVNTRRIAELQQLISTKTKELNELHKNNASDEAKKAKMEELNSHLSESMRHSMRPMIVALPLFVVVYYFIFPFVFPSDPNVTIFSFPLDYKTYFIIASIVFGIFLTLLLQKYDQMRLLKEKKQQEPAAQ